MFSNNFQSSTPPGHELKVFSYDFSYDSADKTSPSFASQEKVFLHIFHFTSVSPLLSFYNKIMLLLLFFPPKFRSIKIWALMSSKLYLKVSMHACLPMAKQAQGRLTP